MLEQNHDGKQPLAPVIVAPIPDPHSYTVAPSRSFRPAFTNIYLIALACNALPLLVIVPLLFGAECMGELLKLLVSAALVDFVAAKVYVNCGQVLISEAGIETVDSLSRVQRMAWAEIASVKTINLLGLKYLRVCSKANAARLWLPLFLADMPAFSMSVAYFADAHNPLRHYFQPQRSQFALQS